MADADGGPVTTTRVEGVMEAIRRRIDSRQLPPGARLPSVRQLAGSMAVSKSTVVEAYDRMVADGTIRSRPGSGFFVEGLTRPLSLKVLGPDLDRAIDPLWVTRQAMSCGPDVLKPGWGWLPSSWLPDESVQRGLRQLARDPDMDNRTAYGSPLGFAPLRQQLAFHLAERGVRASPDQILLTDSATQGLDLLCRFLLEPGDAVLVDDPCYFNFHAMLLGHRVKIVGVPFERDGPDLDAFAQALAIHRPRLYLTNAGLQNPTGATLSAAKAHRLLKLAEQHDTLIVEDEAFADLELEAAPRLAAFDGLDRVIQVGSYSKTVSAALRSGYVAARPGWIESLVDLKLSTSLGNSQLSAVLLHRVLTDGSYRRHLDTLRIKLGAALNRTMARLAPLGIEPWIRPRAGLFVWARLPDGLDAAAVARAALAEDVIFAPGNVFSAAHSARSFMRFNASLCADPRIFTVLERTMGRVAQAA